jgi:Zn-finger nucleic acid-binding protein
MSERSGIEIDYCPTCRGVWLDRGELDKIIERSLAHAAPSPPPAQAPSRPAPSYEGGQPHEQYQRHQQPYRKKRKESWLSEIFD